MADQKEDVYLTDAEHRSGGGHRSDENGNVYWLDLEQLEEYERADGTINGDDEFWAWFAEFRDKNNITKKRGRVWQDHIGSAFTGTKDYMSKWWSDWGWKKESNSSTGTELTRRLALAVKAVGTTVKVVNETGHPWRVRLASDDVRESPKSYSDFEAQEVVISPRALLDTTIQPEDGIRVTTGYGLHEGSHIQESQEVWKCLRNPDPLYPLAISSIALNVLEDDRIESITAGKFPGFTSFFEDMKAYLWSVGAGKAPKAWTGEPLETKVSVVIASSRWPDDYKEIVDASTDPGLKEMYDWTQTWRDDYLNGAVGPRESIIALLEKLKEDEQTGKEMAEQEEEEKKFQDDVWGGRPLSDEEFDQVLKQLKSQLKGVEDPCPSGTRGQKINLSEEQAQQVSDLIDSQLQITKTALTFPDVWNGTTPHYLVTKPLETDDSRHGYVKPNGLLLARMRNAFFFRRPKLTYSDRMQRNGGIDEDELWRVADSDYRVFERKSTEQLTAAQVTMLIDASGSMSGPKLETAQRMAIVMLECLRTMRGVRARVRAHTSGSTQIDGVYRSTAEIFRIWEPGDPMTRLGLLNSDEINHNANWDGFAIQYCLEEMAKDTVSDEQKVLIVLSDGLPNGDGMYDGMPAMEHMRKVTDYFEAKHGITTIQIALDPYGMRPEQQAIMFKHWIAYESDEKLPVQLTKLLIKLFGNYN